MKTVKFYNKQTKQWEPIAGISTIGGGVSDYNDLLNAPDLSIYALQKDLEALRAVVDGIASHVTSGSGRVEYTVDSETITYALRSTVQETIIEGSYLPELSNGYNFIKLKLKDGNETTNLETPASDVDCITIYYPIETTYVKFANTRVKEVIAVYGDNINDARGMFYNCTSLVSADLSYLPASVSVDTSTFEGVNPEAQIKVQDGFDVDNSGFAGTIIQPITGLELSPGLLEITERGTRYRVEVIPNEPDRPMSLSIDSFEDDGYGAQYETFFDAGIPYFEVWYDGTGDFSIGMGVTDEISGCSCGIDAYVRIAEQEPEEEYITGFTLSQSSITLNDNSGASVQIIPNESDRPMSFYVPSYDPIGGYVDLENMVVVINIGHFTNGTYTLTVIEEKSGLSQTLEVILDGRINLTIHYESTDGSYFDDMLELINKDGESIQKYLSGLNNDSYGNISTIDIPVGYYNIMLHDTYPEDGFFDYGRHELTFGYDEIWISDSDENLYFENPKPEEPSEPEEPDTPESPYIKDFTLDKTEIVVDDYESGILSISITPDDWNKEMNFSYSINADGYLSSDSSKYELYEYIGADFGDGNLVYDVSFQAQYEAIINIPDEPAYGSITFREEYSKIEKTVNLEFRRPYNIGSFSIISDTNVNRPDQEIRLSIKCKKERAMDCSFKLSCNGDSTILDNMIYRFDYSRGLEDIGLYINLNGQWPAESPTFIVTEQYSQTMQEFNLNLEYKPLLCINHSNLNVECVGVSSNMYPVGNTINNSGSSTDFGWYGQGLLDFSGEASISVYYSDGSDSRTLEQTITIGNEDMEIWIVEGETGYHTERPEIGGGDTPEEPEEPEEPEDDGLVEMVFHINDMRNAFNKLTVTSSHDPYIGASYDLENAPTDDYGKVLTIRVKPNANNDFNLDSYTYVSLGQGVDLTGYSEIWCNVLDGHNPYQTSRPEVNASLEQTVTLKINYYAFNNGDYIRLDEAMYQRNISYIENNNNWYVYEQEVMANVEIDLDVTGNYIVLGQLTADKEIWLLPHDTTVYESQPEVPLYETFNTRVHLHKQGSDYSEGWHLYVYTGNSSNAYDIPQENVDEFGLYFDISESLYTNIPHAFQFYNDAGDWLSIYDSKFTETHSELWIIDGDSTIYTEKPEI